jgi:hypothetical protein
MPLQVATISGTNGSAIFQNATDTATAFQVQKVSGSTVLDVDTANGRVGIGTSAPGAFSLDVAGAINTSSGLWINGVSVCSSSGCNPNTGTPTLPSSTWIQNSSSTTQAANFNIQSASPGTIGGIIEAAASQTADLLDLENSAGTPVAAFDKNGSLTLTNNIIINGTNTDNGVATFQATGNSTTALRILQATSGIALFTADTTNLTITVNGNLSQGANGTQGTLVLNDSVIKSTQTNALTTASNLSFAGACGTPTGVSFGAGSTNEAGSVAFTPSASSASCTVTVTFAKPFYGSTPKSVVVTPTTSRTAIAGPFVSSVSTTAFTISFGATPNTTANGFYYWIIE